MEMTQDKLDSMNQFWERALLVARENLNSTQRNTETTVGKQEKFEADLRLKVAIENYHYHLPLNTEIVNSWDLSNDKILKFGRIAEMGEMEDWEDEPEFDIVDELFHQFNRYQEVLLALAKSVIRTLAKMESQPKLACVNLYFHTDDDNPRFQVILKVPKEGDKLNVGT